MTDVDRLEGRIDDLGDQVRALAESGASDRRVDELESRLEDALRRIRELERER